MVKLTDSQAINRVLQSSGKVVMEFEAAWCTQCPTMTNRLESIEKSAPAVLFCKVDTGDTQEAAERFQVMSVPSVICFEGGEEKLRFSSISQIDNLRQFLNGSCNGNGKRNKADAEEAVLSTKSN